MAKRVGKRGFSKPRVKDTRRRLCPVTNKRGYNSDGAALRAAADLSTTYVKDYRTYKCMCGYWHLTTRIE